MKLKKILFFLIIFIFRCSHISEPEEVKTYSYVPFETIDSVFPICSIDSAETGKWYQLRNTTNDTLWSSLYIADGELFIVENHTNLGAYFYNVQIDSSTYTPNLVYHLNESCSGAFSKFNINFISKDSCLITCFRNKCAYLVDLLNYKDSLVDYNIEFPDNLLGYVSTDYSKKSKSLLTFGGEVYYEESGYSSSNSSYLINIFNTNNSCHTVDTVIHKRRYPSICFNDVGDVAFGVGGIDSDDGLYKYSLIDNAWEKIFQHGQLARTKSYMGSKLSIDNSGDILYILIPSQVSDGFSARLLLYCYDINNNKFNLVEPAEELPNMQIFSWAFDDINKILYVHSSYFTSKSSIYAEYVNKMFYIKL